MSKQVRKQYRYSFCLKQKVVEEIKQGASLPSEAAQYVEVFLRQLRKHFSAVPVTLADERFTSKMAFRAMIDSGVKKMNRRNKETIDKVSAVLILQGYLDFRSGSRQ